MGKRKVQDITKAKGPFYIYRDGSSLIGIMDTHDDAKHYIDVMGNNHAESTFEILSGLKKPAKEETEG